MSDKAYDTDGEGRWWVTTWQDQCPDEWIFGGKCQGVTGHDGKHWRYREDGTYEWWTEGDGGGWSPPLSSTWVSPVEMAPHKHTKFHTTEEVTDPVLIAKLEAGEVEDPITAPCTPEEIEELKRMGRLPDDIPE